MTNTKEITQTIIALPQLRIIEREKMKSYTNPVSKRMEWDQRNLKYVMN